jgi:hypothetical protein
MHRGVDSGSEMVGEMIGSVFFSREWHRFLQQYAYFQYERNLVMGTCCS